jgi:hypothetical protein
LYWHKLALAYYRNGQVEQFVKVLREALKDNEINIDGSNQHMFDDKKARNDAMNSLASYCFQMHEVEMQKINVDKDQS